jgi:hypothetical protein
MMLRESTLPKAYLATISAPSTQGEKAVEYQKMPARRFSAGQYHAPHLVDILT